ncbi:MAG: hypothetical protein HRU40_21695, partial [Saprospiraceae bacterium]|nr:hypothetical protein [Saprospiraceae bacterium]
SKSYTNNITGGQGDDSITGGYSQDNYHYNLGDGNDVIQESGYDGTETSYTDKLIFGADITPDMVSFSHNSGGDLLITITDPDNAANNGSIRVVDGYINGTERIEVIEFASDGTGGSNLSEGEVLEQSLQLLVQSYSSFDDGGDEDLLNEPSSSAYLDVVETNYI